MKLHTPILFTVLAVSLVTVAPEPKTSRPRITGIAMVRIINSAPPDAAPHEAALLHLQVFGFAPLPGCEVVAIYCLGINEHQVLGLITSSSEEANSGILEIIFETSDVEQLRDHLNSAGFITSDIQASKANNRYFSVRDPEGHRIGFIQRTRSFKLDRSPSQVSTHLIHAGFVVNDRAAEDHFYKDVLGFRAYWHGGMKDDKDDWVAMQVPDGTDWIEYMLNVSPNADKQELGVMNHIALGVPDIHAAEQQLLKNGWMPGEKPQIGRDGKWQLNLYDPDQTRIEFMEFTPIQKPCCSEYTGPHPKP
jgi:catechol 2,3-dioxygenase-like lactoylglutathione lyase family enzyme